MHWSEIPRSPTNQRLRQFAALCLAVFGLVAMWHGLARGNALMAVVFAAAALAVGIPGLIRPQSIRWFYVGWMMAAWPIGWLVSQVLLGLVYFGLMTPLAMLFRLLRRDALCRRRPQCDSYWVRRPPEGEARRYFRQS